MPYPSAGRKEPSDVRSLLVNLLHDALITIRNETGGARPSDDELVHHLADWTHNWPNWLEAAQTDADHADIWDAACRFCHPVVRNWAQNMLRNYGVTPHELGLTSTP